MVQWKECLSGAKGSPAWSVEREAVLSSNLPRQVLRVGAILWDWVSGGAWKNTSLVLGAPLSMGCPQANRVRTSCETDKRVCVRATTATWEEGLCQRQELAASHTFRVGNPPQYSSGGRQ